MARRYIGFIAVLGLSFVSVGFASAQSTMASASREEFLAPEGWVASNGRMGTSAEVEYQISIPDGVLRLAVSTIGVPNYDHVSVWPAGVEDDCVNATLLTGPIPEQVQFSLDQWAMLGIPPEN